jgi:hypothetical protein
VWSFRVVTNKRFYAGEKVDWIIHNASILSAVGEMNPDLAMKVMLVHNVVFKLLYCQYAILWIVRVCISKIRLHLGEY